MRFALLVMAAAFPRQSPAQQFDVLIHGGSSLRDRSTFFDPHQYSAGVNYVLVNGRLVVDGGKPTWALPGVVITPASNRRDAVIP